MKLIGIFLVALSAMCTFLGGNAGDLVAQVFSTFAAAFGGYLLAQD